MLHRILSILGWVGTALVFGAVAIRFTRPEWDQYATWSAWAGLGLVVLYTLGQWREIVGYFRRRQARYGAIATVGVLVALAIVVAVNYLGARQNKRWDLTASRQHSLSEQTVKVLQSLEAPVKFTVFDRQTEFDRFRGRLDGYAYNSRQVSVEYIDPDMRPVVAREYDVQAYGTVVVDYMGRRQRVTTDTEQDLTNALIKAMSTMERKVYFLEGHGEKEFSRTERDGYTAISGSLRRDNYTVERLVLAQQKDVPADATVVVIAGPTTDVLPAEADALRRYLGRAGKLMILLDPPVGTQAARLPNLEAIIREWGIDPGHNVVVDVSGATNEPSIAVAAIYPPHAITERFATLTIYPLARAVEAVSGGTNGRVAQSIVETSRQSWAESNLASLTSNTGVAMDEASGDEPGPISLGAAVSAPAEALAGSEGASAASDAPKPETRVVVFGDSDFATNAYAGVPGNANLFANAISWLAQQENLIAIRPTAAEDRRVTMTPRQQTLAMLTSMLVLPALVFAAGIFTWWRRR
ncbi:MAG: Gldg family protein [Acidobacteria bacterium]|nr:Gldg family protein [Acidobacteriota bacterium]